MQEKQKILVADDEIEIADLVELYLKNEGFQVQKYYDDAVEENKYYL